MNNKDLDIQLEIQQQIDYWNEFISPYALQLSFTDACCILESSRTNTGGRFKSYAIHKQQIRLYKYLKSMFYFSKVEA